MSVFAGSYTLRPASAADHHYVDELMIATARSYVTQVWSWSDEIRQAIGEDFERWFNPPESGQIVQVEGQDSGYLKVIPHEDELLLDMIMLKPELHGRWLGRAILAPVLGEAAERGLSVVLQVMKVNPATHLYKRLGFQIAEELPHHYVMRRPG